MPPKFFYLLPLFAALLLTGCHTSKPLTEVPEKAHEGASTADYAALVARQAQRSGCLTAKVKLRIKTGKKELSVNGTLRMKRDDVVQLSLRALGFEVGRLEFTQSDVLLVDRFNSQYVRASYDEVAFLRRAGLNFYAVQALFWNELFAPGSQNLTEALPKFQVSKSGATTKLRLDGAAGLVYNFQTKTSTARITKVTVQPQSASDRSTFEWEYDNFSPFGTALFPHEMNCAVKVGSTQNGFSLSLSNLGDSSDWEARTTVSSKYKRKDANALFNQLLGL